VIPKSDVFNTPTGDKSNILDDIIEGPGVPSLPDILGDGSVDSGFLVASALCQPEVGEVGGPPNVEVWKEEIPNFPSLGASQQEVVGVFILGAGEAGSSVAELVSKTPLIGGETLLPGDPTENLALEGGSASPNLSGGLLYSQMPERVGIDTFVREFFVSEAVPTSVRSIMSQGHGAQLVGKVTEVGIRGQREARSKGVAEAGSKSSSNIDVGTGGVREKVREAVLKRGSPNPKVSPEGDRGSTSNRDFGDGTKGTETGHNIFPNGGVKAMGVTKISGAVPAVPASKPRSPGSIGVRVEFREEFYQEGRVLGVDGENAQPPTVLWDTEVIPCNFAVPTVASFFTSPQESTPTLVDSLDNPSGEETSGHGMSKHGSENIIHKDQATPNGHASATPPREAHVAFLNDGGEIRGSKFVGRQGEPKVGLGKGGDNTPEGIGHAEGRGMVSLDGNGDAFVEIDDETGGRREAIQESLEICNMLRDGPDDNEGIIGILKDRAGEVVDKRV
jgi:hypothetical protein